MLKELNCQLCHGVGFIHIRNKRDVFNKKVLCPQCGKRRLQARLDKSWRVTALEAAKGLTPYESRGYKQVIQAWQTTKAFSQACSPKLLALHGHQGVGKTHLLLILRQSCLTQGITVIYVNAVEMQNRIQQFSDENKRLADHYALSRVQMLIIDEFDEFTGEKIQSKLLSLFNERLRRGLATAVAFKDANKLNDSIKSRLRIRQEWVQAVNGLMRGWVDMTQIPDARESNEFSL